MSSRSLSRRRSARPSRATARRRSRATGEIAAAFAPVFYQGLGDNARADYITNFDFDGDWRGDNNWANADDKRFPLRAYVYYAVSETPTHFLVHYALFHPRDYKGGGTKGVILSEAIKEGARMGGRYDPTGLSSEAVLAHENDMEGCLVVAAKSGGDDPKNARVVYVETLGHDRFQKYAAEGAGASNFKSFAAEGGRASPFSTSSPKATASPPTTAARKDSVARQARLPLRGRAPETPRMRARAARSATTCCRSTRLSGRARAAARTRRSASRRTSAR